MVCVDGPVITAGAAFAQTDLVLHLLRERGGARLADRVARMLLLDGRQVQARYVIPEPLANGDPLIARITAEIARSLPSPPSIAALAARLGASGRTLSRHVRRVTGHSTSRSSTASARSARRRCCRQPDERRGRRGGGRLSRPRDAAPAVEEARRWLAPRAAPVSWSRAGPERS